MGYSENNATITVNSSRVLTDIFELAPNAILHHHDSFISGSFFNEGRIAIRTVLSIDGTSFLIFIIYESNHSFSFSSL